MGDDGALGNDTQDQCANGAPTAREVFEKIRDEPGPLTVIIIFCLCTVITVSIFIEEAVFITRHFRHRWYRAKRTIYVLGIFPIMSVTALFGVVVPRSATLVDLICDAYFATIIYVVMRLCTIYMGGYESMVSILCRPEVKMSLRTGPCCCWCFCLPKLPVTRKTLRVLSSIVLQVSVFRPILMFVAAVAWSDGVYDNGGLSPYNASGYITVANMASTLLAVYGLILKKNMVVPHLGHFRMAGKITIIQLTMMLTVVPGAIIGVMSQQGLLPCTDFMGSKDRAARVTHCVNVPLSLVLCLCARHFFRRREDSAKLDFGLTKATIDDIDEYTSQEDDVIKVHKPENGNADTWVDIQDPVNMNASDTGFTTDTTDTTEDRHPLKV